MTVTNVSCISLGITEKPPGEFQGKPTQGYFALDYVVVNESSSRREYLDDVTLKNAAMRHCGVWGGLFKISGDISAKGVLKITSIEKEKEQ